jgi:DNA-binding NarL/FixJ family response regulator
MLAPVEAASRRPFVESLASPVTESLRVLLVQDDEAGTTLIRNELTRSAVPMVVNRADCEASFVTALDEFAPDVVLSDHVLQNFDALTALNILRERRPTAPLIVVTKGVSGAQAVAFVRAGAEDLVLEQNIARLPAAITRAISSRRAMEKLTRRQIEVLKLVAEGRRTREIAKELKLSVKTVESHRGELMKRLGVRDVVSLVHYAVRVGLVSTAA